MTVKNYGVWKMQDWKMTDKLAGIRVSVFSVLTLWPLCQIIVKKRRIVNVLTSNSAFFIFAVLIV